MPRGTNTASPDITAVEVHFSRSLKIRFGVLDFMASLANQSAAGEPTAFESLHHVSKLAANHVWLSGWDRRPCSTEAALRWVDQWSCLTGPLEIADAITGGIVIHYRTKHSKTAIAQLLKDHRPRRRRKAKKA